MGAEQIAAALRAREAEWNDLRHRRGRDRLAAALAADRAPVAHRRPVGFALAAAAVVVMAVVAGAAVIRRGGHAPRAGEASASRLALDEGSEATLSATARVRVNTQRPGRVELTQSAGEVRYRVRHDPSRDFVVHAGRVTVRVRGTQFAVAFCEACVEVRVFDGRVEVDDGTQVAVLRAGDVIRLHDAPSAPASVPAPVTAAPAEPAVSAAASTPEREPAPAAPPARLARNVVTTHRPAPEAPSDVALLAAADDASRERRFDDAASALATLVATYPSSRHLASALFTLGRVERARRRFASAAEAFARCWRAAPSGALAEDALAEEAAAWASAGHRDAAQRAARSYQQRYPEGAHAARIRVLAE